MDVYEAIRSRVAVREFESTLVADAVVKKILLAARWAPSQRNRQPWRFVVVRERETLRRIGALASSGPFIADAPLAIAVAMEGSRLPQFDAARAIENMILTAWSLGVGTVYVQGIDRDAVKDLLGIPEELDLITVMPFGYPTEAAKSVGKRRKPLAEIASVGRFGQPYHSE